MPYFNFYKRRWRRPYYKNTYRRRFPYRRRRPRRTFQHRNRKRWVRRKTFYKNRLKKLKRLKILQFQPNKIRKCKIRGYLQLFGGGYGKIPNNFTFYKESTVLPHEPGGGGWGLQQLTLNNLYVQNKYIMNWWSQTNKGYNLCRYLGTKIILYRQQNIDYIFTYDIENPYNVTKYYYASQHPIKLLQWHKRIIVPSHRTMPHKKKNYVKRFIRPPKELLNKWYFQQHFSTTPLIQFTASAVSLTNMFQAPYNINNNVSLFTINTSFFQNSCFNPPTPLPQGIKWGYQPRQGTFIYGIQQPEHILLNTLIKNITYLGNCTIDDPGDPMDITSNQTDYGYAHWGNPFHFRYLHGDMPVFITSKSPEDLWNQKSQKLETIKSDITWKHEPMVQECRYNPNYDQGIGNVAYWVQNSVLTRNNWEPLSDPILKIEGFPLWLLLWGWEDFTKKLAEVSNLEQNYMLVIQTKYLDVKQPHYVFLSENYFNGQGPYGVSRDEINISDKSHWFPKWRFQAEAINALLMSGPGVCKCENQKSVSAHMKYTSFFKWGGNPSSIENIYDPTSQPTYPMPNLQLLTNEITDPTTNIKNYIYTWDTRRDLLTQRATERITDYQTYDSSLFTDGEKRTSTDIPLHQYEKTQEKKTTEEEEQTLLLQLQQQQQHNQLLRQRLQQLTQIINV